MKTLLLSSLLAVGASAFAATPSGIFPNPQEETVGGVAITGAAKVYRLTGESTADANAVAALKGALSVANYGTIEIVIGEKGDDAVAAVASLIPVHPQGYYLKVEPGKVTIAGADEAGTYYGVQSFLQIAAKAEIPAVEVKDWPRTEVRGVIEGYYGNPWSWDDCLDMCDFFDYTKQNIFIYGPKNDSYHHGGGVFTPYPADQAAELTNLVNKAREHKIDIVWAMHPGNSNDGDNLAKAKAKLEAMYELGFRRFAVFFDDISANSVQKQIDFLNYLNKEVVEAKGDVGELIVCPSEYCISFAGGQNTSSTYLNSLGAGLDKNIHIMWTGWQVVDMELGPACDWFTNRTGRKPFIWHNYPCSDYGSRPLLLCPYEPAVTDLASKITGFTANPMEYYEASKPGLVGMADYAWNPEAYDPWEAWEEAIQYMMPEHADAFRTYCYSNFNYPAPKSHGKPIIYTETPEFKALLEEKPFSSETLGDYKAYFEKQVAAAQELQGLADNRLVVELAEWLDYYYCQSNRGIALSDMRKALDDNNPEAFLSHYIGYDELTKHADALTSRDYEGSLRVLSPFCGSQFVEPFITATVDKLVDEFKETGADYPADLFPARMLENGNYYILYKGRYLTNKEGSTKPQFVKDVDNINPNRQVWTIKYVSETGRFNIVSAEDNRYVNELGNFGVNEYSTSWNTYTITSLGGLYAIQNGGSSGTNFWTVTSYKPEKGTTNEWNTDNFMFQIIPAGEEIAEAPAKAWTDGDYVVLNPEGQYLTRSGNSLKFNKPGNTVKSTQKWTLAIDPETKRIKMTQGSYYVNEKPVIGTNQYYASWNSYKLFEHKGKYAIQNAGDAGTDFWTITEDGGLSRHEADLMDAFEFRIISVDEASISEVESWCEPSEHIYDLQGRRILNPTKGLYIINGQKIIK